MKTKLTLSIERQLIQNAKAHAKRRGTSVSEMVTHYFRMLDTPGTKEEPPEPPQKRSHSAFTKSLTGILSSDVSEEDYYRHLEEKHR